MIAHGKKTGFSLLETIIYIALLVMIIIVVSELFLWMIRSQVKTRAIQETTDNARRAMEVISQEVRSAETIYLPTSLFDSDLGQLSLKTTKYLPSGETTAYIDFYLCHSQLCLKKEGLLSSALTSDKVEVKKLKFTRVKTGNLPSVEISLEVSFKNPKNLSIKQAVVTLSSVASLRGD